MSAIPELSDQARSTGDVPTNAKRSNGDDSVVERSKASTFDFDPQWWSALRERLHRIVQSRAGEQAVDDVLQDVALAATRSPKLPPKDPERSHFIVAITLRQTALWLRRRYRDQSAFRSMDTMSTEMASPVSPTSRATGASNQYAGKSAIDDPIFFLMTRESAEQTRACLDRLEPTLRDVLVMKYVQRSTYQTIAERYGWTRHVAEYRVRIAKEKLRRLLVQCGLGEEENES